MLHLSGKDVLSGCAGVVLLDAVGGFNVNEIAALDINEVGKMLLGLCFSVISRIAFAYVAKAVKKIKANRRKRKPRKPSGKVIDITPFFPDKPAA